MEVQFHLINHTKKEVLHFNHISPSTARDLAGNTVPAAITTWYLLLNRGDRIEFVPTFRGDQPFPGEPQVDVSSYDEVTDEIISSLIEAGILQDNGVVLASEEEPNSYLRVLQNIWPQRPIS